MCFEEAKQRVSCKIVLRPSFSSLLPHLRESVASACKETPLAPKWVIAPNRTAAAFLRSTLTDVLAEAPLFGVRVLPLPNFIQNLLLTLNGLRSHRWTPLLDFLLLELISRTPEDSPLAPLKTIPLGHQVIRPALMDLADAGLGDSLDQLEELANDPCLEPIESAFLRFFLIWTTLLRAGDLRWEPLDVQQLSTSLESLSQEELYRALGAEREQTPQLFVYGFYDFTDINLQMLTEFSKRLPLQLYFPAVPTEGGESAHSFSSDVLEDFKFRLGEVNYEVVFEDDFTDSEEYFSRTFPDGIISDKPDFVSFQRASGARAEAISAAIRIESWIREGHFESDDIVILVPGLTSYYETVLEIFASFKIPLRVSDLPVKGSLGNHPLQIIRVIWEEQAPLEWLLYYLREFPSVLQTRGVNLQHFEKSLRSLPFRGGPGWTQLTEILRKDGRVGALSRPRFFSEEVEFIREIEELWNQPPEMTPTDALAFLNRLTTWLEEPGLLDPLIEGLNHLSRIRPEFLVPSDAIAEALIVEESYSDDLEGSGVLLSSFMRARGITAKAIVVIGLSSDQFPPRVEEDPFLSDRTRVRLAKSARDIGHRLSPKRVLTDEMALLFFLINTSAERVHWVIPETDENGKSVSPTPWVMRYLQRWNSKEARPLFRPIPRAPVEQALYLQSLDQAEGSLLPPDFAPLLDPGLGGAVRTYEEETEETGWAGHVPTAWNAETETRFSVTRLQELARCPFRFWAGTLRKLEAIEVKRPLAEIDARSWGQLVHSFFESILDEPAETGEEVVAAAHRILESNPFESIQKEIPPMFHTYLELSLPFLRGAYLRKLIRTAINYLQAERDAGIQKRILAQELCRSEPFPGMENVQVVGKLDRVDQTDSGIMILDYKTGKTPWPGRRVQVDELRLGFYLQPSLYPWLYDSEGKHAPGFSYFFLGEQPPKHEPVESTVNLSRFFEGIREILTKGSYFATSNEIFRSLGIETARPCQNCEFGSLCRRSDPLNINRNIPLMRNLANRRFEELLRLAGQSDANE